MKKFVYFMWGLFSYLGFLIKKIWLDYTRTPSGFYNPSRSQIIKNKRLAIR